MTSLMKCILRRRRRRNRSENLMTILSPPTLLLLLLLLRAQHANSQGERSLTRGEETTSRQQDKTYGTTTTRQSSTQRDLEDYTYLLEHTNHSQQNRKKHHYTFAIVTKQSDLAFYEPVKRGCEEKALQLTQTFSQKDVVYPAPYPPDIQGATVECLFVGPDDRMSQAELVEHLLWGNATGHPIDGVAISVYDEEGLTPLINRAVQELKVPVLTFDSDASQSMRHYYVGTNNSFFGTQLARAMETLKPNGGPYGIITGPAPNMKERVQGIVGELNHQSNWHHRWKLLDDGQPFTSSYNLTATFAKMEEWAQLNPTVIVSTSGAPMQIQYDPETNTSYSLWKEFVERHRHRNITFLCGDAMDHQLEFLQSNYVDGLVGQLPFDMGVKSIQTLWTLTFDPTAELGDPEDVEDGDDNDTTDHIGTNVISHVHIPLRLPPVAVDNNLVGDLKFLGFVLYGIIAVTAIGFAVWVFVRRNVRVVRVAQPRFLIMIAIGILILGSCMIPLGMDDAGGTRADCFDSSVELGEHCTAICMSVPWFASLGFTITFSALYSKTRRINRIFHSNTAFGRVKVSERDVLVPFFVLLGANVIILTLWTLLDPLTYTRINDYGRDGWNRVISTYGVCQSEHQEYYLTPLAIVNIGVLVLANWQAYEARDIEAEFSETKYIGICMASMLQAMVSGIPVLFIVSDLPKAYYIVLVLLIFIICMVILVVMFVPKIVFAQQYMGMSPKEQRQFMTDIIRKTAKSTNTVSRDRSSDATSNQPFKFSGSHFSVKPLILSRVSSLGMRGPSTTHRTNTDNTNTTNQQEVPENGMDQNGVGMDRPISGASDSAASDDTGLVFYRKSYSPAMMDPGAVAPSNKKCFLEDDVKQSVVRFRDAPVSNNVVDSVKTDGSGWTNVHNDVIAEGEEEESEEQKEEEEDACPMDGPEHAQDQV